VATTAVNVRKTRLDMWYSLLYHVPRDPAPSLARTARLLGTRASRTGWRDACQHRPHRGRAGEPHGGDAGEAGEGAGDRGAGLLPGSEEGSKEGQAMKVARSGHRGVYWRGNPGGSQELRRPGGARERGDWWICWYCALNHKHRELIGPKT